MERVTFTRSLWRSGCAGIRTALKSKENGFNANRDTIRDDVEILNDSGVEVLSVRVGRGKGYHVGARLFELAELKMLVDAVSSSRFITMGKSQRLIEQITKLTNEQNRPALTAKIFTADRIKSGNTNETEGKDHDEI